LFSETLAMRRGDVAAEDKCIEGLARESTRLQDLIDRLLDWGRMESGRREFRLERTDVVEVAKSARAAFTTVLERRPAELTVELPDEPIWVDADRDALVDAILNLLTNAHKYGGDPPHIRFRLQNGGDEALISVTDNGPGIEPREHERIFQKFYRVDDRLSREREGSGLGLSIVKHVVRAHRGRIELDSGPGQGSTFRIVLAKKSAPDAPTRPSRHT
jgi:two-component system, OmpR family, phosphate regulon sensor histidine kinase PhoR